MRVVAKFVDWMILMILCMCTLTLVATICGAIFGGEIISNVQSVLSSLSNVSTSEEGYKIYEANKEVIFVSILVGNIVMCLTSVVYFGLIGIRFSGSIGKKIFNFEIEPINKEQKITSKLLILREPIIYIQILTVICTIVSYFIYTMFFVQLLGITLLVFFIRYKEFWNTKNGVTVKKYG